MRPELPALRAGLAVLLLVPFALITALVAGGWAPLHAFDRSVADGLHTAARADPVLTTVMTWWTHIFQPNVFRVAALVLAIWLIRRGHRRTAAWVAATMVAGGLLGALLKLLIGRDRPEFLDPVGAAVGFAFPSGHALNSVLGVAVFVLVFPRVKALWAAAVVIPLVTALSRVVLGVHWTSDVVAGLLLGVAVVVVTVRALRTGPPAHDRERLETTVIGSPAG